MRKIGYWLMYGGFAIWIVLLVYIIVLMVYPFKVLEITNEPMPVNSPIRANETLNVYTEYCKYVDLVPDVYKTMIGNGEIIVLDGEAGKINRGCGSFIDKIKIPDVNNAGEPVKTGEYYIHYKIVYNVNAFKTSVVEADSQPFIIIKAVK